MPLIEEIPDDEAGHNGTSGPAELLQTLRQLANRLALPEEFLSAYLDAEQREIQPQP
jgi:hypothetical protein